MQIEKPKPELSRKLIILALVIGLIILSLPFLAQNARSKSASDIDLDLMSKAEEEETPAAESPKDEQDLTPPLPSVIDLMTSSAASSAPDSEVPAKSEELAEATMPSLENSKAILISLHGDVNVKGPSGEQVAAKNRVILKDETIQVGSSGEAVLEIDDLYILRLKPGTRLTQLEPLNDEAFSGKGRLVYRFKLEQGALLGTTKFRADKTSMLSLLIKDKEFRVQDSTFRVELSNPSPWIGVLRGSVKSDAENPAQKSLVIHALEKMPLTGEVVAEPLKVSREEWSLLQETYEMNVKTAVQEAQQIDLSKRAGDFFQYVFDHGTFYTENVGYTVRDFYEDKIAGSVYLEAEYDVFPENSFVGLYVFTRDLDARDYGGIRFEVRRKPEEGYPERFYVEIKSKGQILHRFEITDIKPEWQVRQFDFFTPASTSITEVTFVFFNENVGPNKKGYIQMQNIQMIPLTPEQKNQRAEAEKNPLPAKMPKASAPTSNSAKEAVVTAPIKKAKKIEVEKSEESARPVAYKTDTTRTIAKETPKVVSFADLSE